MQVTNACSYIHMWVPSGITWWLANYGGVLIWHLVSVCYMLYKYIWTNSIGYVASTFSMGALSGVALNCKHLSHCLICLVTSSVMLGQKNWSLKRSKVLSIPKCPKASWYPFKACILKVVGSTDCMVFLSGWSVSWVSFLQYKIPFLRSNLPLCLRNCFISGLSVSLPLCNPLALYLWMISPITLFSLNSHPIQCSHTPWIQGRIWMTKVAQVWYDFWCHNSFTNYLSMVRDGRENRLNGLRTARNGFNVVISLSCNDSSNYSLNGISSNDLITFLPINPRQSVCFYIPLSRLLIDMEVIVRQASDPSVPHCIQLGSC